MYSNQFNRWQWYRDVNDTVDGDARHWEESCPTSAALQGYGQLWWGRWKKNIRMPTKMIEEMSLRYRDADYSEMKAALQGCQRRWGGKFPHRPITGIPRSVLATIGWDIGMLTTLIRETPGSSSDWGFPTTRRKMPDSCNDPGIQRHWGKRCLTPATIQRCRRQAVGRFLALATIEGYCSTEVEGARQRQRWG